MFVFEDMALGPCVWVPYECSSNGWKRGKGELVLDPLVTVGGLLN